MEVNFLTSCKFSRCVSGYNFPYSLNEQTSRYTCESDGLLGWSSRRLSITRSNVEEDTNTTNSEKRLWRSKRRSKNNSQNIMLVAPIEKETMPPTRWPPSQSNPTDCTAFQERKSTNSYQFIGNLSGNNTGGSNQNSREKGADDDSSSNNHSSITSHANFSTAAALQFSSNSC